MLLGIGSKVLSILAKEVIPFVLSILIRDGLRKLKKKVEKETKAEA